MTVCPNCQFLDQNRQNTLFWGGGPRLGSSVRASLLFRSPSDLYSSVSVHHRKYYCHRKKKRDAMFCPPPKTTKPTVDVPPCYLSPTNPFPPLGPSPPPQTVPKKRRTTIRCPLKRFTSHPGLTSCEPNPTRNPMGYIHSLYSSSDISIYSAG